MDWIFRNYQSRLNKMQINFITNLEIITMATLKMPDLDLFHPKKTTNNMYDRIDSSSRTATRRFSPSRHQDANIPHRQYENVPIQSSSRAFSQNKYKSIAENYLQKRSNIPLYYLQPTSYVSPLAHHHVPHFPYHGSPQQLRTTVCECQQQTFHKDSRQQKISNNPYMGQKQTALHKPNDQKLLKDPYLIPTFRNISNVQKSSTVQKPKPSQSKKYQNHSQQNQQFDAHNDSNLMQKLKTHQSNEQQPDLIHNMSKRQAQIQTDKRGNTSSILQSNRTFINNQSQSKINVENILLQQNRLIESLKYEYERENPFKNQMEILQQTKDAYIEKSRQLLLKLNELADDNKQFSFVSKFFAQKKQPTNVFRELQF